MGNIILLDENTANKIAAGEVVDRPASVVKELVENSLDAGATTINVEVGGGGLTLIRVSDNGNGIAPEDVPLALQRHATSKIRFAEDISAVLTLGFRGEALPSIAAVSRFCLSTRQVHELAGTQALVEGGRLLSLGAYGCPTGTEVRVEDLFFNTPARLKFIKSAEAEAARIADTLQRLALSRPDVSFSFVSNGKMQLTTAGNGQLKDVVYQVYGRQNARLFLPVDWQGPQLRLSGFVSHPSLVRVNRSLQSFFINKRYVHSPLLSDALQTAFQTLLPRQRFPAAVLFMDIDPAEVDVNVHPAKREVRFSVEKEIYRAVLAGLRQALNTGLLAKEISAAAPVRTYLNRPPSWSVNEAYTLETEQKVLPPTFTSSPTLYGDGILPPPCRDGFPVLEVLGRAAGGFILAQSSGGDLYIIDQHAAHERLLYETLLKEAEAGELPVQEIVPQAFELDPMTAQALEKSLNLLARAGLTFEVFGNNSFILRTVPLFYSHFLNKDEIRDLLAAAAEDKESPALFGETVKMMSCKAAIKGDQPLAREEMSRLLHNLREADQPYTCPHGRPTVLLIKAPELAKYFRRC